MWLKKHFDIDKHMNNSLNNENLQKYILDEIPKVILNFGKNKYIDEDEETRSEVDMDLDRQKRKLTSFL